MYDVIIIGAGPGGYVSAIRAAELGQKVAIIEQKYLGGTCLNVGCIPSKTYLNHSHWILEMQAAKQYGIKANIQQINFPKLVYHKNQVVTQLQNGIKFLFKKNKVDFIEGHAQVQDSHTVIVNQVTYNTKNILLDTGSHPFIPPITGLSQSNYLTTDDFFDLQELPNKLVIIGGGVIAIEIAFAIAPLKVDVSILEVAPDILLTEDEDARTIIKKRLQQLNIKYQTAVQIKQVTKNMIELQDGRKLNFDKLLVATGRHANLDIAKDLNIKLDSKQHFVQVDKTYQTSIKHIYAVGDLIGGYQLAHAASAEGLKAIAAISGNPEEPLEPSQIPRCLYTDPEVASFGLTAKQAQQQGYQVQVEKVPLATNGKAIATNHTAGFMKLITEKKYQQILGAVIVSSNATELIQIVLATVKSEGTVNELANQVFAHPTFAEIIGDTANGVFNKAVNH